MEVVKGEFPTASSVPGKVHSKAQSCSAKQEQEFNMGKSVSPALWEKEPEAVIYH